MGMHPSISKTSGQPSYLLVSALFLICWRHKRWFIKIFNILSQNWISQKTKSMIGYSSQCCKNTVKRPPPNPPPPHIQFKNSPDLYIYHTNDPFLKSEMFSSLYKANTCSKGLFVLIPLPPTNTQLSLNPSMPTLELPNSAIRFLASSFSLFTHIQKKKKKLIRQPNTDL